MAETVFGAQWVVGKQKVVVAELNGRIYYAEDEMLVRGSDGKVYLMFLGYKRRIRGEEVYFVRNDLFKAYAPLEDLPKYRNAYLDYAAKYGAPEYDGRHGIISEVELDTE